MSQPPPQTDTLLQIKTNLLKRHSLKQLHNLHNFQKKHRNSLGAPSPSTPSTDGSPNNSFQYTPVFLPSPETAGSDPQTNLPMMVGKMNLDLGSIPKKYLFSISEAELPLTPSASPESLRQPSFVLSTSPDNSRRPSLLLIVPRRKSVMQFGRGMMALTSDPVTPVVIMDGKRGSLTVGVDVVGVKNLKRLGGDAGLMERDDESPKRSWRPWEL